MKNVDISDQLRVIYWWDHWMRKRKWWWSIMLWEMQVMTTNAYVAYMKYMVMLKMKHLSHYEFLESVCQEWICEGTLFFRQRKMKISSSTSSRTLMFPGGDDLSTVSSLSRTSKRSMDSISTKGMIDKKRMRKNVKINDEALDPFKGLLKCRLNHNNVMHMPTKVDNPKHKHCQLCYWGTKKKNYKDKLRCDACRVNLCIDCYAIFHQEESIVAKKTKLFP